MSRPASLVDLDWMEQAVQTIRRISKRNATFTSEDLRREMEQEPEHPNRYGVAFRMAAQRKYIEAVGYRPSRDKSRNGGSVRVWQIHPDEHRKRWSYLGGHAVEAPHKMLRKSVRLAEMLAAIHGKGIEIDGDLIARQKAKERRHG